MAELRDHLDGLDLENVATFLASGNVVFDLPTRGRKRRRGQGRGQDRGESRGMRQDGRDGAGASPLEREIEDHLEDRLGFSTEVFVRPLDDLAALCNRPLLADAEAEGFTPYVVFVRREPTDDVKKAVRALETPDDRLHPVGCEVVWLRRGGIGDTTISPRDLEKALGGMDHTRRKLTTVRRIVAKFGA